MKKYRKPKARRHGLQLPCQFELLEYRRLLSTTTPQAAESAVVMDVSASNPSIADVSPANNATGVARDTFISCDLNLLQNAGTSEVDPNTLAGNVTLTKTADNEVVVGTVKTSGGGDSIDFTPTGVLEANAEYTFQVTSGVKDLGGNSFTAFTSHFTTGTKTNSVPSNIRFDQIQLPETDGHDWTSMVIGPDGDLYAADDAGYIIRYVINPDGTLGASHTITTVRENNIITTGPTATKETEQGERIIAGMVFDPKSTADNPILWITSGYPAVSGSPNWTGKVSKLTGKNLTNYQDEVVNLPRSFKDHLTEGISFGPDGAIYISQASNSAMGAPDTTWDLRSEELLNASILRLDPSKLTNIPLNAQTADGGTYNPFAKNAPLSIYASGIRNSYDPVWTDDGFLFAATNGSSSGGNSPAGPGVPAEMDLPTQPDYLYNIVQGGYYGHPNPLQGHYVENGGNPTSGVDPGEVTAYPVGTQPDPDYKGFIFNFGNHESPDGEIEYKGNFFNGALKGDLLIAQYAGGSNIVALSRKGATITGAQQSIAGFTGFNEPLAIVEDDANGNVYVGQYGGQSIMLLRVNENPLATTPEIASEQTQLLFNAVKGATSNTLEATLLDDGIQELDISTISLSGTDAGDFKITTKPTLPASLEAGQSTMVGVQFKPSSSAATGLLTASLTIKSNDPAHSTFNIQLRGLATTGSGGVNEPSLQAILDLYQIPDTVGDDDPTTPDLPIPPQQPNDEIVAQLFTRADTSTPVTETMLATFDNNANPVANVGYYSSLDGTEEGLFSIDQNSNQTIDPSITGATSFFPGPHAFGLYVNSPQYGHTTFSEDSKNTFDDSEPADGHLIRVYPMKNPDGSVVANAYVVAVETESNSAVDNQDVVFEITNVKPTAAAPSTTPPAPPTGLNVVSSAGEVQLAWTGSVSDDVAGYIIKRSTNSKKHFIILTSSPVNATTYSDTTPGKKKYYYRVFAEDTSNRLSDPAKVTTTVTAPVAAPALSSLDIGAPTPTGSTNILTGDDAYDMVAGGADVQGTSDQFRFAYTPLTGNFDVKVRLDSITAADVWSKGGLMARESLDADAANAYILASPTEYRMSYRLSAGATTTDVGTGTTSYPNTWLRLTRVGNVFTGYTSTDGVNWTELSSITITMDPTIFVGLAATSHNTAETTTAQFRQLAI